MNRSCIADRIGPTLVPIPLLFLLLFAAATAADAFCGFYVAQEDAKIYNQSSKVVLARDGNRTVLTMSSDFQGDPKEFAVVVPVPVVLRKEQVHIGDPGLIDRLHDYSVPRLVEYRDPPPCPGTVEVVGSMKIAIRRKDSSTKQIVSSEDLKGVVIEAQFKVTSTTSSSCPRRRDGRSTGGCAITAIAFPRGRLACCRATSSKGCTSSSPRWT